MLPRFPLLSIAALFSALLGGCSQAPTDTPTGASRPATAASTPAKRTSGTQADSLNGVPGHTFGESLSRFTNLVPIKEKFPDGVRRYQRPPGKESGWFGKHEPQVSTFYQFQDGQFAAFQAAASGKNQALLLEQARYLFGPGQDLMGNITWNGERVLATYTIEPGLGFETRGRLAVWSKPLLAQQAAAAKARLQAENAPAAR